MARNRPVSHLIIRPYIYDDLVTIDANTGLMWAADGDEQGCNYGLTNNWNSAIPYCSSLSYAGYTDWRLPNVKELQSIVDYETGIGSASINSTAFPHTKLAPYWTSTTNFMLGTSNLGWCVYFVSGTVNYLPKSTQNDACLRAVRGGL